MSALILWNLAWSAALAVVVFTLGRLPLLQRRPALMHLLWFGVLLRLVVPALVAVPILPDTTATVRVQADFTHAVPQNVSVEIVPVEIPEIPQPTAELIVATDTPSLASLLSLTFVLAAIWLSGTLLLITVCLRRSRRIARLIRQSMPAADALRELTGQLACDMKLRTTPSVRLVEGLATPSVSVGFRQATIILPRHLVDELNGEQWSCILAHELAHLARGDAWFNLAAAGVLLLFWWNPVAWWAFREMRSCQEASCDALAIARKTPSRRVYSETLLQVVESWNRPHLLQPQVVLGFGNRTVLTRRFEMIANVSVRPRAALAAVSCLALLALTFFCLPVRGDKQENNRAETITDAGGASYEKEWQKLQGVWQAIKVEVDGKKKSADEVKGGDVQFIIHDENVTLKVKDNRTAIAFKIDPTTTPKSVELSFGEGKSATGIYDVEGDTFQFCVGPNPMTEFKTKPSGNPGFEEVMYVFQRLRFAQADDVKQVAKPGVAVEQIRLQTQSWNNIKKIMLALHNYHDAYGAFPPAALYGQHNQGGQHAHSWRVALLPFLEQADLYGKYKFNEPWDSPANKEVQATMPAVFRDPTGAAKSVNASYFVLVGKLMDDDSKPETLQTLFSSKKGMRIRSVFDGTSNTLSVVEAKRDIPWTKPDDIAYDPAGKLPALGGVYQGGFYVGLCDGSARFVSEKAADAFLKVFFAPADGAFSRVDEFTVEGPDATPNVTTAAVESASATETTSALTLKYDDGKADGKKSIAGTGEMIHFTAPDANHKLKSLLLHCARYGTSKPPNEDVDISILSDDEQTVLHTELVPYSRFKRGESRWTPIEFKTPVEVPEKFWIVVDFNAEQTKGVYLSYDTSTEGQHSKTGVPGGESKPVTTGGDWMIQAVLTTK